MAWTYSGNPAASARDEARWHLGDTTEASPLVQDEEMDFCLVKHGGNATLAAAMAAEQLAAKWARRVGVGGAGISVNLAERVAEMRALATRLRSEAQGGTPGLLAVVVVPVATGLTQADLDAGRQDPQRVPLMAERDYPSNTLEPLP